MGKYGKYEEIQKTKNVTTTTTTTTTATTATTLRQARRHSDLPVYVLVYCTLPGYVIIQSLFHLAFIHGFQNNLMQLLGPFVSWTSDPMDLPIRNWPQRPVAES